MRRRGLPDYPLPSLDTLRDTALPFARVANPGCKLVGIVVNTKAMGEDEARTYLDGVEKRMGLPAIDPCRDGTDRLVDALAAL